MPEQPEAEKPSGERSREGNDFLSEPPSLQGRGTHLFCGHCGAALVVAGRFCGACGAPRDEAVFGEPAGPQLGAARQYPPVPGEAKENLGPSVGGRPRSALTRDSGGSRRRVLTKVLTFGGIGGGLFVVLLVVLLGTSHNSSPTPLPGSNSSNSGGGEVSSATKAAACARVQTLESQLSSVNSQISANMGNLTNGSNSVYRGAQSNLSALSSQASTLRNELTAQNSVCQGR